MGEMWNEREKDFTVSWVASLPQVLDVTLFNDQDNPER